VVVYLQLSQFYKDSNFFLTQVLRDSYFAEQDNFKQEQWITCTVIKRYGCTKHWWNLRLCGKSQVLYFADTNAFSWNEQQVMRMGWTEPKTGSRHQLIWSADTVMQEWRGPDLDAFYRRFAQQSAGNPLQNCTSRTLVLVLKFLLLAEFTVIFPIFVHGNSRGIIVYIEYQSVCPFVGIGSPSPPPQRVCLPPLNLKGRGATLPRVKDNSDYWKESLALCILCDNKQLSWCMFTLETSKMLPPAEREERLRKNRNHGILLRLRRGLL
jgi:hypothetical protein